MISSVDMVVVAHCADYLRRKEAIEKGHLSKRTMMELRYLNFKMLDAACELVGDSDAEIFISEIGARRGYASSSIPYISEVAYKQKKQELKLALARKIHLID